MILLYICLIAFMFFNYKTSTLNCGLFGACGNKKHKPDPLIIKLLGLLSIDRGEKGSGLFISNEIKKTHKSFKEFNTELVINDNIEWGTNSIIGHTRAPTFGVASAANSHPFGYKIKESSDTYDFIFSHNGTLKDHKALGEKYDEDWGKYNVDSEMFGSIIFKNGFEVLKEYKGAAAFAATRPRSKNSLMLWSGASKQYAAGHMLEERPLWYAIHPDTGVLYYASEKPFLEGALNVKCEIIKVPYNTLLYIKEGKITKQVKYDRSEVINNDYGGKTKHYSAFESTNHLPAATVSRRNTYSKHKNVVQEEDLRSTAKKDQVVWFKGYCYINDKKAHGPYTLDKDGILTDEGETTYFYGGIHIENKEKYDKITIAKLDVDFRGNLYKVQDYMSPETLIKQSYYWKTNECASGKITPKFSLNTLTFDTAGEMISCDKIVPVFNLINDSKNPNFVYLEKTPVDKTLEAFNYRFDTKFNERAEATLWYFDNFDSYHDFWDISKDIENDWSDDRYQEEVLETNK